MMSMYLTLAGGKGRVKIAIKNHLSDEQRGCNNNSRKGREGECKVGE
jgi:hypothetical protein